LSAQSAVAPTALRGASDTNPSSPQTVYDDKLRIVLTHWSAGEAKEAARGAADLIKADPSRWEGYATAAVIEEGVGNNPAAKLLYQQSLSLAPEAVKPRLLSSLLHLSGLSHVMSMCDKDHSAKSEPCATEPQLLDAG
jgi:hypothetical protein